MVTAEAEGHYGDFRWDRIDFHIVFKLEWQGLSEASLRQFEAAGESWGYQKRGLSNLTETPRSPPSSSYKVTHENQCF